MNATLQVAYVTLTATARVLTFTKIRCPSCGRWMMSVPGRVLSQVLQLDEMGDHTGRGRVVVCPRCSTLSEVIEHGCR